MYAGDETHGDEITSPTERPVARHAKLTFEEWIAKLNRIVENRTGMSLDDLEDFNTRDGYDDDMTPSEFYRDIIADELGLD